MMKTRILAFLLVFCMLFGILAGCSKDLDDADPSKPGKSDGNKTPGTATDAAQQTSAKYAYTLDELPLMLDVKANYINPMCVAGDYLYVSVELSTSTGVDQPLSTGEIVTAEEDIPIADREPDAIIDDPVNEPVTDEPEPPAEENPDGAGNTEIYTSVTRLYRVDLATGNAEQMPGYTTPEIPEGFSGYTSVNRITAGTNGSVWIYDTMNSYMVVSDPNGTDYDGIHYDSGDYVEGPSAYRLRQFSASGEELASVDITGEDGYVRKNLIAVDENDHLYFNNWEENTATIEDASGKVLKTLDLNQNNGYMMTFCDQTAIQIYDGEKNQVTIQLIDPETFELGEPIEPPTNAWSYMRSYDEAYDYYYIYNNDLYGYKQKERVSEQIVSWMDCDIDSNYVQGTYPLRDGRILGIYSENYAMVYDSMGVETGIDASNVEGGMQPSGYTLLFLTKTDASNVKPKTVLTLACMYMDWNLKSRIVAFNKASEDYRIVIKDYSQYATNDDYYAGGTLSMPVSQYAAQGSLTDLRPYIDADPELSGDHLMAHVLDAASIDGKLYQAFSSFSIASAIGLSKVVGEYDQWTLTEVKDALSKLKPGATVFSFDWTREQVLQSCFSRSYEAFIDWDTGKCSFDGQDFRELLEFVNSFPENFNYNDVDWSQIKYDVEALNAGDQLLIDSGLYSLDSYGWTLASFGGQDITFVGYPSATGNNNVFRLGDGLCISSTCKDKDGAWSFVRTLFTKGFQEENRWNGLPTNADVFNAIVKDMMTLKYQTDSEGNYVLDENGQKIVEPKASYWFEDDRSYDIDVFTQEQIDQVMDLYNKTNLVMTDDQNILDIVKEETAGYFAGQKSLDDTVRLIQNRVSLYVAEQK